MTESKEKLVAPLDPIDSVGGSEENIKRDTLDMEGDQFFKEFVEGLSDMEKTDASLQILLRRRTINVDEAVLSALEKINGRIAELENTRKVLGSEGNVQRRDATQENVDDEFYKLMSRDKDKIETELDYLLATAKTLGYLLRNGTIITTDTLGKTTEAVWVEIRKFTSPK